MLAWQTMKVAFTSDVYWPRINGVTVSTNVFLNELTKLGHEIHLWAPEYPEPEDQKKLHHQDPRVKRLHSFGLFFSREDRWTAPWERFRFFSELDSFQPQLLHVQTEFALSFMARKYARKRGIPMIQTCHTYFEQYISYYMPWLGQRFGRHLARSMTYRWFRHADAIIAPTVPMKEVLESYGITCPITVVPTGIPEEDFRGITKEDEHVNSRWLLQFPQMRSRKMMLYVGRVGQEKNMDFLLDVVERVIKDEPSALLVVAGNGPYFDTFHSHIAHRNLGNAVLCLGYVDHQELKHLYALADIFTFASVTETQGLVTIEAMMCGTPAVAVGKMGTKEVMAGDNGGFMVEEDVTVFSDAVLRLLKDPVLYQVKSAEAKAYAQNWTAGKMAKRIEALYEQVVKDYKPKRPRRGFEPT
jgi:glycosyltransferase involved in cell wall biosynthesis